MGLKILHSADWHLDSPFAGFSGEQRAFLKAELRKIPEKVADLCRREQCDLVLLSGDLFDGPPAAESVSALRDALAEIGVPVFISPGNHDFLTAGSVWFSEKWPQNVKIFDKNLSFVALPQLNCRVYGAGYTGMDCPGLLADFRAEGEEDFRIAVLHGDPMQLHSPYCPITTAQVRDSGLDYLALGHIHRAGSFRAGDTLCAWPGCPMGRGFDETQEKGVYIVTLSEQADARFVPLDTPRFYDLEVDTQENAMDALEAVLPAGASRNCYRLTLTGSGEGALEELYAKFSHLPNLELRDRREAKADIWENAGADTLEGTYFRLLREKMEQAAPEAKRSFCLAAEISRKLLQGKEVVL